MRPRLYACLFVVVLSSGCVGANRAVEPDLSTMAGAAAEHMWMSTDATYGSGAGGGAVGAEALFFSSAYNNGVPFTGLRVVCSSDSFGDGITEPTSVSVLGEDSGQADFEAVAGAKECTAVVPNVRLKKQMAVNLSGVKGLKVGEYNVQLKLTPISIPSHSVTLDIPVKITAPKR
jgi:hypothetical protein